MVDPFKFTIGLALFGLGQVLGFFQLNLRYMYPYWENKGLLTVALFSLPIGLSYYYAWGYVMSGMGESAWASRFVSFGISYLIFPVLTYYFLGESMLSLKTLVCVLLSFIMIYIQIVW